MSVIVFPASASFTSITDLGSAERAGGARVSVTRAEQPRLRLTRRGRAVVTVLAATPLVVAALLLGLSGGSATATGAAGEVLPSVTVTAGQSLWGLAQQVAPGEDPLAVVIELQRLNALDSPEVFAGQQIVLPARLAD